MLSDFVVAIINGLAAIYVPVIVAFVVGLVTLFTRKGVAFVQAHTNATDFATLETVVSIAVRAAQQVGATEAGAQRKAIAMSTAQAMLDAKGIKGIDVSAIDAAIEAAVFAELPHPIQDAINPAVTGDPIQIDPIPADQLPAISEPVDTSVVLTDGVSAA